MDVVTARPTELDRYAALARTTGIIGIAFLVLLFGPIIALSVDEPPLDATAAEAVKYFGNLEATWAQLTQAASTLGMIGSLWFFVAFGFLLRRAEGDPPWRSTIATLSGALLAAFGLIGVSSAYAASLHGGRITPEVADYAYAFGSVGFANIWIALASFAVCSGWVILSTRVLERWMGWWIVVAGLCLVVARFVWTAAGFWGVGYALVWLWIIVVCIRLIVRPDRWGSAAR
jgi:hypothetical protein